MNRNTSSVDSAARDIDGEVPTDAGKAAPAGSSSPPPGSVLGATVKPSAPLSPFAAKPTAPINQFAAKPTTPPAKVAAPVGSIAAPAFKAPPPVSKLAAMAAKTPAAPIAPVVAPSKLSAVEYGPMQRPVMNPIDVRPPKETAGLWQSLWRIGRMLLRRRVRQTEADPTQKPQLGWRLIREMLYRAALLPPLVMLAAAVLVYQRTHPPQMPYSPDPISEGIYYQPVSLLADDGVRLEGWLVPALEPKDILAHGQEALLERHPAVVLAHGFGMSREQVLPLVQPMHERGWVVLAVGLRGSGTASPAGQTFGLNEALDIEAAVGLLRRRPYVDATRIAVVGIGSGANAALLAADKDSALAALALDSPARTGDQALAEHCKGYMLNWLTPICRWTFQIGYGLNLDDLDMYQYGKVLASRPTLIMRWSDDDERELPPDRVRQIADFLTESLPTPPQKTDSAH